MRLVTESLENKEINKGKRCGNESLKNLSLSDICPSMSSLEFLLV